MRSKMDERAYRRMVLRQDDVDVHARATGAPITAILSIGAKWAWGESTILLG
jgi:hypothetical protein